MITSNTNTYTLLVQHLGQFVSFLTRTKLLQLCQKTLILEIIGLEIWLLINTKSILRGTYWLQTSAATGWIRWKRSKLEPGLIILWWAWMVFKGLRASWCLGQEVSQPWKSLSQTFLKSDIVKKKKSDISWLLQSILVWEQRSQPQVNNPIRAPGMFLWLATSEKDQRTSA